MNKPIGSDQYRSVVVRQPTAGSRRWPRVLLLLILLIMAMVGAFFWGEQAISARAQQQAEELRELRGQMQQLEQKYQQASQQLANLSVGAEVDRFAVNDVRQVVREHKQTINQLNEEISFYKGLMAPTDKERGLSIRSWELSPGTASGRFQFKLVIQQLALKHQILKGEVSVMLVGKQARAAQSHSLNSLSEQLQGDDIKLRFKYFQAIDGSLQLPAGFEVDRIDIVARATAPKKVQVEKHFSWFVAG